MNFEIRNIINQSDLKINLLTYDRSAIDEIDLSIFSHSELKKFITFGADKRKLEFYFSRVLWRHFKVNEEIYYNQNGKPLIPNGHISISHSATSIAVSYSKNHNTGIDIEHFNPKIKRIRKKFLSEKELKNHNWENEIILTTLWSIKEAVYKFCDIPGLSFRDAIKIVEIGKKNKVQLITENSTVELNFNRIIFDDFVLTYCLNDLQLTKSQP